MEEQNKIFLPIMEQEFWLSPEENGLGNHPSMLKGIAMSTPHYQPLSASLEESAGSSRQDSGYRSATPLSSGSLGVLSSHKCPYCSKLPGESDDRISPETAICHCSKRNKCLQPPYVDNLKTISENTSIGSRGRQGSRPLYLFNDSMDTSLYLDEIDRNETLGGDSSTLGSMEIGEENSIDILDGSDLQSSNMQNSINVNKEMPNSPYIVNKGNFIKFLSPQKKVQIESCEINNSHKVFEENKSNMSSSFYEQSSSVLMQMEVQKRSVDILSAGYISSLQEDKNVLTNNTSFNKNDSEEFFSPESSTPTSQHDFKNSIVKSETTPEFISSNIFISLFSGKEHFSYLEPVEIGEEDSIDFSESNGFLFPESPKGEAAVFEKECTSDKVNLESNDTSECCIHKSDAPVISCDIETPKVLNETTPKKNKKYNKLPAVVKTITTLNRVIRSFSLNGIEKIDILYQLNGKSRSCPDVISNIFSHLSEKDLDSVSLVSKAWNKLLYDDKDAFERWKQYKSKRSSKENFTSPTKSGDSVGRRRTTPFSPLQQITNQRSPSRSPPLNSRNSPPVSPKSARFRSFEKAGQSLKKGDRLLPCPKCYFPSHDRGSPTVECSRSGCRHHFCVWCRNEVCDDKRHNCPSPYTPRTRRTSPYKMAAVGSKTFKQKLRRL